MHARVVLGVSCLERCPPFKSVLIEREREREREVPLDTQSPWLMTKTNVQNRIGLYQARSRCIPLPHKACSVMSSSSLVRVCVSCW